MLRFDTFQFDGNFFARCHVCAEVDVSKGPAADFAAQTVFLSHTKLHLLLTDGEGKRRLRVINRRHQTEEIEITNSAPMDVLSLVLIIDPPLLLLRSVTSRHDTTTHDEKRTFCGVWRASPPVVFIPVGFLRAVIFSEETRSVFVATSGLPIFSYSAPIYICPLFQDVWDASSWR